MNKTNEKKIINLMKEALEWFWKMDCEFMLSLCTEDVTWIGAQMEQFQRGYDAVEADVRAIMKELSPCYMLNQEFYVVQNFKNVCTVVGRYLVRTDDDADILLQAQQRSTFVWELIDGVPKIKHMHISNPLGELKVVEGASFVSHLGKMSKKYLTQKIKCIREKKKISITDLEGVTRFVALSEILYAMAQKKYIVLYTTEGEIIGRMEMKEFVEKSGTDFLQVHRSYVINKNYVAEIEAYMITMTNGDEIPVPVKKYTWVLEKLESYYEN